MIVIISGVTPLDSAGDPWDVVGYAEYPDGHCFFVVTPLTLMYTRHNEHEADRFGLEISQDNNAAARAFVALQVENLANPRPGTLYKLWRSSHPTLGDRIDFCNEYRPWETGEPLKHGELFDQ